MVYSGRWGQEKVGNSNQEPLYENHGKDLRVLQSLKLVKRTWILKDILGKTEFLKENFFDISEGVEKIVFFC
jgi:hypothetical protein